MKPVKSFFKVVKKFFVFQNISCSHGRHKFLIAHAKSIIIPTIIVPCLLQFPLVSFGYDGPDDINSSFVPFKCISESIHGERVVTNCRDFFGKGFFVFGDGITNDPLPVPSVSKNVVQDCSKSSSNKSEEESKQYFFGITHNDLIICLCLLFGFVCGALHANLLVWLGRNK